MRTSLRTALTLLPLTALLGACSPGGDGAPGDTATTGELATAVPGATLTPGENKYGANFVLAAGNAVLPFSWDCRNVSSCSLAVSVAFDKQTLENANLRGLDGIADLTVIDSTHAQQIATVPFGMTNGTVTASYKIASLPNAFYSVMLTLRQNLPQPDFRYVTLLNYCLGTAAGGCDKDVASHDPGTTMKVSGRVTHTNVTNIELGTFTTNGVADQQVELVKRDGTSIAQRFAMITDAAGNYTAVGVLPDAYAIKVAGELYPVSVNANDVVQQLADIDI